MAGDSQTLAGPKEIFLERHFSTSLKDTPDNLYELACRYVLDCVSASECVCVCVCVCVKRCVGDMTMCLSFES